MRRAPHIEHELPDDRDSWWVCSQPERPHDDGAAYLDGCPACRVALDALVHRVPGEVLIRRNRYGEAIRENTAADALAHALDVVARST